MNNNHQEMLQRAVDRKTSPIFMSSRSEVISHFQDKYGTNWKSHAAAAVAGTTDKKSRAYKSASRQFQMNSKTGQERYKSERVTAKTKARYEAIGKHLPPIGKKLKGNSITVKVTGMQGQRERSWTATFKGTDAYEFMSNPTFRAVWKKHNYPEHVIEMLEGEDPEDNEYALDVTEVA